MPPEDEHVVTNRLLGYGFAIAFVLPACAALIWAACSDPPTKRGQSAAAGVAAVPVDFDDIGGVVSSSKGPEAGVWVTRNSHDALREDRGYRRSRPVPHTDLPKAEYSVWVRGYD